MATDGPLWPGHSCPGRPDKNVRPTDKPLTQPVDVHVRHQWPPQFTPPPAGPWVIFQHWEFGSLPRSWIEPMSRQVDEVWVASQWVRNCFVQSGIPADQVQVIPLGVDPARFATLFAAVALV